MIKVVIEDISACHMSEHESEYKFKVVLQKYDYFTEEVVGSIILKPFKGYGEALFFRDCVSRTLDFVGIVYEEVDTVLPLW